MALPDGASRRGTPQEYRAARKPASRKTGPLKVIRKGTRLSLSPCTPQLRDQLAGLLTYNKTVQVYGQGFTDPDTGQYKPPVRGVEIVPTQCFVWSEDPDHVRPPCLLTGFGYWPKIKERLAKLKLTYEFQDNTPSRPGAYDISLERVHQLGLRLSQRKTLAAIAKHVSGRVCCPTAWGKSFLARAICMMYPKARIDITTHSKDVLRMLHNSLSSCMPNVGMVTGAKRQYGDRITCYSGKSLHRSDGKADILLVDEIHEFGTADYLGRLLRYQGARIYGLSANRPGDRTDKADFEIEGVVGPLLIDITYEEAVAEGGIVDIEVDWYDVVMDVNPCDGYSNQVARKRWGLWRNDVRNRKIAELARKYVKAGQQVLVTVETVEHACFLKKYLPEFALVHSEGGLSAHDRAQYIAWGLLPPNQPLMTLSRRYKLSEAFESGKLRGAIANTVWDRGVNFVNLDVLIRADARASAIPDTQVPGRLSRKRDGKGKGRLIDFNDQFDKTYFNRAKARRTNYRKMGWVQNDRDSRSLTNRQLVLALT